MGKYGKVIILLIFVVLIAIPVFELIYLFGIKGVFSYFSNQIIEITGINQYLAKAIVLLLVIPFIWAFRWMFSISSSTRMAGYAIVAGYMVLFYFSMYFLTKNQMFDHTKGAMKYCAQTPEGWVCFDTPGVDPKYGIELKLVDPKMAKSIALRKNPPRKIDEPTQFFDFVTREPLIWYYELPDGTLQFYDQPGFHPKYAEQLKPVTPEIVKKYEKKKAAEEEVKRRKAAMEEQRRKEEIARAKAEEEEAKRRKAAIEEQRRKEEIAPLAQPHVAAETVVIPATAMENVVFQEVKFPSGKNYRYVSGVLPGSRNKIYIMKDIEPPMETWRYDRELKAGLEFFGGSSLVVFLAGGDSTSSSWHEPDGGYLAPGGYYNLMFEVIHQVKVK